MNRLALKDNQTTVVRRYGFWDYTSPTASCPYFRGKSCSGHHAHDYQNFSVPIQTPTKICVAVNGEAKCLPVVDQVVTAKDRFPITTG
jgi:hypothetical protein